MSRRGIDIAELVSAVKEITGDTGAKICIDYSANEGLGIEIRLFTLKCAAKVSVPPEMINMPGITSEIIRKISQHYTERHRDD